MRGTVSGLKQSLSGMFWINGDDGVVYFSHVLNAKDRANKSKYLYNGNRATFEIEDEGKDHLTAINVWFDEVEDPDAEVKHQRRLAEAERRRLNEEKKAKAYIRNLEEQVKHYQKLQFKERYVRYVIQICENGVWKNYKPDGKPRVFTDHYKAKDYIQNNKPDGIQMRLRKAKVVRTRDGLMIREIHE